MRVVLAGLSHKSAPLALREKLSLYGRSGSETLHAIRDAAGLRECAALSTCNRTEVYGLTSDEDWQERLLDYLAEQAGTSPGHLQDYLYFHEGTPAVRHLFRVASGLDSMVVGEGQILGQVREALQQAGEAQTTGTVIHNLLQSALACGKRARTETEIGRGAVSVSMMAVQLARQIFERLAGRKVLLVGAGETGEQTARLLLDDPAPPRLLVCNRTSERAVELAERLGGAAVPFAELEEVLAAADIVITSTGSSTWLISRSQLQAALRRRRGRPLFLIDIAVPRDVEPAAADLGDVYLYNIDDLQELIARNLESRRAEAEEVERIVEEEKDRFHAWMRSLAVGPTIQELQGLAEGIVAAEWERIGGRLSALSQRDRDVVDALVRGVVNKLLRPTILHLRESALSGNGYHEVEAVRAAFGLGRGLPAAADTAERPPGEDGAP